MRYSYDTIYAAVAIGVIALMTVVLPFADISRLGVMGLLFLAAYLTQRWL